ncbi:MAG: hypothetical protein KZQ97_11905 [Candidatus Thiodiazotropha sp. (ex Dulcina madagascariensis)]|nr:hypothetical protein [Candidatus Thiodiazotropha sp. (ex Dulcina madagascariensis)]
MLRELGAAEALMPAFGGIQETLAHCRFLINKQLTKQSALYIIDFYELLCLVA